MPNASFPALSRLFKHAPRFDRYRDEMVAPLRAAQRSGVAPNSSATSTCPTDPDPFLLLAKIKNQPLFPCNSEPTPVNKQNYLGSHRYLHVYTFLRSLQGGSGYFYFLKPPEHLQWRKDLSLFRPDLQQNCRAASLSSRRHSAMASYAGCPVHSHPEKPSPQ